MRAFLALTLPETCIDEVRNIQGSILTHSNSARLTTEKNLHVTLAFMGDITERHVKNLILALENWNPASPRIQFRKLGWMHSDRGSLCYLALEPHVSLKEVSSTAREKRCFTSPLPGR